MAVVDLMRIVWDIPCTMLLGLAVVLSHRVFSLSWRSLAGLRLWDPPTEEDLKRLAVSEPAKVVKKKTKTAQRAERRKGLKADKVKDKDEDEKEEDDEDAGERTGVTIDRTKEIPIHKRTVEESDIGGEHSFYYTCLVMCLTTILVSFAISEVARYMYGMQHWLADGQGITLWCIIIANVFVFVLMITMQVEFVMNATGASDICLALMVAMMSSIISIAILLTHNAVFDFRIDEGFQDLKEGVSWIARNLRFPPMTMGLPTFNLILAAMCGQLGLLLLFPTLHFVRAQVGAERHKQTPLNRALLYGNIIAPLITCISFMHIPIPEAWQQDVYATGESPQLFSIRLGLIYLTTALRLATFRIHVQNYLDMAPDRIMKLQHMPTNLKRWQRRRTWAADVKVPAHKVCGLVTHISDFLCGQSTYLMLPVTLMVSSAVLLRTRGTLDDKGALESMDEGFSLLGSRVFYRSMMSFFCWWQCMFQFISIIVGYIWFDRRRIFSFVYNMRDARDTVRSR